MKFLKILFGLFASLTAIYVLLGLLLSNQFKLEERISIRCPDSVVYNYAANVRNYDKWNAWTNEDPDAKITFVGDGTSVGSLIEWDGKKIDRGFLQNVKLEKNKSIQQNLVFENPVRPAKPTFMFFKAQNHNSQTLVRWYYAGTYTSNFEKIIAALFFEKAVCKDMRKGLQTLKVKLESGK